MVRTIDTQEKKFFTIRQIEVTDTITSFKHIVEHIHFYSWPDFGTPKDVSLPEMVKVVDKVSAFLEQSNAKLENQEGFPSKLLVHCKKGIGRSGSALCMINAVISLRHQPADKRVLSVFSILRRVREQRRNAVQTTSQYEFIFKFLKHYLGVTNRDPSTAKSGKKGQCSYNFKHMRVGKIQYRMPVINFNTKPFNGQKFNE